MKVDTIPEHMLPEGIWHKTHITPKPVGVPLYIKVDGKIFVDCHTGSEFFLNKEGSLIQNTVYSYDKNEEWFEIKNTKQ